jgi:uncharacterized Zn finger protein
MGWGPWDNERWYPPSRPREARGGIRAQSKRGRFGESWWAGRWIAVLESFDIGARLQRGRSYARQGQVLSIDVEKGIVSARVQGSRHDPYIVSVKIRQLTPAEWRRVAGGIAGQAIFAAKLLAAEMPHDIEDAFKAAGLSLFPEKSRELATACSCPDWSNPCKHVAAVYYLLGEEFDRDPFLLFRLRGLEREELMALLREPQAPGAPTRRRAKKRAIEAPPARQPSPPPSLPEPTHALVPDATRFWQATTVPDAFHGAVETPHAHAALVHRLGRFPFWRGETPIADALASTYEVASGRGLEAFLGASGPTDAPIAGSEDPALRRPSPGSGRGERVEPRG